MAKGKAWSAFTLHLPSQQGFCPQATGKLTDHMLNSTAVVARLVNLLAVCHKGDFERFIEWGCILDPPGIPDTDVPTMTPGKSIICVSPMTESSFEGQLLPRKLTGKNRYIYL